MVKLPSIFGNLILTERHFVGNHASNLVPIVRQEPDEARRGSKIDLGKSTWENRLGKIDEKLTPRGRCPGLRHIQTTPQRTQA
jgi:hypothetical protein